MLKGILDKLVIAIGITFVIVLILSSAIIYLTLNGIRVNRKENIATEGLEITGYEQVYHVFFKQEIFLNIHNTTDKMIGTLKITEKKTGKTEVMHKISPGDKRKMYFLLDSYFEEPEFEVTEIKFVGMY